MPAAWRQVRQRRPPRLGVAEAFYGDFGLAPSARTDDVVYLRAAAAAHHVVVLRRGERARVAAVALRVPCELDLRRLASLAGASPVETIDEPGGGLRVRLRTPGGLDVHAVHGIAGLPPLPVREPMLHNHGTRRTRVNATQRPPRAPSEVLRLGHVAIESRRFFANLLFWLRTFGLLVSDYQWLEDRPEFGPVMAFMRCDRGLAPCHSGRAGDAILDTYEAERRPHVRRVIQLAVQIGRVMMGGGEWTSALRDQLLPLLDRLDWLKQRLSHQGFPPFPQGPLVRGAGAGGLLPQLEARVSDGSTGRIDDLLATGFGVVTAGPEPPAAPGEADRGFWSALDARFLVAGGPLSAWLARHGARAALVRPDRVIFAMGPRADLAGWRRALAAAGLHGGEAAIPGARASLRVNRDRSGSGERPPGHHTTRTVSGDGRMGV